MAQSVRSTAGPYFVSGVMAEGNRITKERVIMRELTIHQGDTVDSKELYARLERSKQNLQNLGLFNTVSLLPTYLGPNEVFITVTVSERWYWWPSPILRFADPNFNTWWLTRDLSRINYGAYLYRYNMRGRNETLFAKMQWGYSKEFGLNYRIPFIDKRQRWGLGGGVQYGEQDELTIGTVDNKRVLLKVPGRNIYEHKDAELKFILRPAHDLRHVLRVAYTDADVLDTVLERTSDYFSDGASRMTYITLGYSLILDKRDSRTFPLAGSYADIRVDHMGLGDEGPDLSTIRSTLQRSWKKGRRWSAGASLTGKVSWGSDQPYALQEGLGYGDEVRGYEYYVIDGKHFLLGKANVLFALIVPAQYRVEPIPWEPFRTLDLAVYLNAFADYGRVWGDEHADVNFLSDKLLQGYGLGLDLVTSYDQVLRLEYTINGLSEAGFYLHFSQPF